MTTSPEENKQIVRRFMEAYNNRELEIFDELVAEDYIDHVFEEQGREYLRQLFTMAFEAFPDWYESIEDIIAEGDRVWVRVKATGKGSRQTPDAVDLVEPFHAQSTLRSLRTADY